MRKIDLFIFDLDGTLIDSKKDIANSVNYTMNTIGLPPVSEELIYRFVGNGVTPLIKQSVETVGGGPFDRALEIFMRHYDQHLLDSTKLFPGIEKVLGHFSEKKKVVATNKPQGFSEKILRGLKIEHLFDEVVGGDTDLPKKPNPKVITYLLEKFQASPAETVIVGDSRVDMETGRNARVVTCGALYGFRPREELQSFGCDFLVERPEELRRYFE